MTALAPIPQAWPNHPSVSVTIYVLRHLPRLFIFDEYSPPMTYSVTRHSRSTVVNEYLSLSKKGWFVIWKKLVRFNCAAWKCNTGCTIWCTCKTRLSARVCCTSSRLMMTSFLRIFMAYRYLVAFSLHRTTLPKVPLPRTWIYTLNKNDWKKVSTD